jgi:hypothetical protein
LTAYIVYGAAIGGLFSLVFALAYGRVKGFDPKALSGLLAFAGFVATIPKEALSVVHSAQFS